MLNCDGAQISTPRRTGWRSFFDEGQNIKNPDSQSARTVRALTADHRLVLTGTPIENRLLDLWSLMAFATPGILGQRGYFERQFEKRDDPLARQRIAARLRPFLLRRPSARLHRISLRAWRKIICASWKACRLTFTARS